MPRSADRRRPGQRACRNELRSVRDLVARKHAKGRIERIAIVGADEIVAILGLGIGQAGVETQVAHRRDVVSSSMPCDRTPQPTSSLSQAPVPAAGFRLKLRRLNDGG